MQLNFFEDSHEELVPFSDKMISPFTISVPNSVLFFGTFSGDFSVLSGDLHTNDKIHTHMTITQPTKHHIYLQVCNLVT
jgi:hypothetical protein